MAEKNEIKAIEGQFQELPKDETKEEKTNKFKNLPWKKILKYAGSVLGGVAIGLAAGFKAFGGKDEDYSDLPGASASEPEINPVSNQDFSEL